MKVIARPSKSPDHLNTSTSGGSYVRPSPIS